MRRDWADAREKIDGAVCRLCGNWNPDACHVIGRARDERKRGSSVAYVNPASVIPMCRSCHQSYDAGRVDILPYLSLDEQVQAVKDAGGLALAMRRICGRSEGLAA